MKAQIYNCIACTWSFTWVSHRGECERCHTKRHPGEAPLDSSGRGPEDPLIATPEAVKAERQANYLDALRRVVESSDADAKDAEVRSSRCADPRERAGLLLLAAAALVRSAQNCLELSKVEGTAKGPGLLRCAVNRAQTAASLSMCAAALGPAMVAEAPAPPLAVVVGEAREGTARAGPALRLVEESE